MWAQLGGEEVIYIYDSCYDNLFLHEFSFISIEKPTILTPKSTFKKWTKRENFRVFFHQNEKK